MSVKEGVYHKMPMPRTKAKLEDLLGLGYVLAVCTRISGIR